MKNPLVLTGFLVLGVLIALPAEAAPLTPPINVTIHKSNPGNYSFPVSSANEAGGLSVAVADLGDDGVAELVIAKGIGNEPRVSAWRKDGSQIGSFLAYAPDMGVGLNVTVCDLNGDGKKEIVTAPQRGGGPHIRIFDAYGDPIGHGFFAYNNEMTAGVNIACGNLDDDAADELVAAPMVGAAPHVRVFKWPTNDLTTTPRTHSQFMGPHAGDTRGAAVHVHNKHIVVANQRGKTTIAQYALHKLSPTQNITLDNDWNGITTIFSKDNALHVASTTGDIVNVDTNETTTIDLRFASVFATAGDIDGDGADDLVTTQGRPFVDETYNDDEKAIVVDLSEQRLYAYNKGVLENSFLISSGRLGSPTPKGTHSVLAKVPHVRYAWSYGVNDPRNYDLGVQPWNLRIFPHIYIHYAPWHNNFGIPQSRGCVNVDHANIQWIYHWADEGIPVVVRD